MCVCVSFLCLVTTTRPRQYSVTIQWVPQSPLPSDLLSYVLEYRQNRGGGRFGEWTTGGSNIDRTASSYVVTLPGGTYEYRVLGVLSSGVRREIEGGEVQDGQGGCFIIFYILMIHQSSASLKRSSGKLGKNVCFLRYLVFSNCLLCGYRLTIQHVCSYYSAVRGHSQLATTLELRSPGLQLRRRKGRIEVFS